MKIGIIGAMQMEVDALKEQMEDASTEVVSGVTYVSGTVEGRDVVAAVCGIGKVFAAICAEAMILTYKVDCIVNIGVAGTLCPELGVMDVAVADKVVQHDMNTSALGDPIGLISGLDMVFIPSDGQMQKLLCSCLSDKGIRHKVGTIVTGDLFVNDRKQREKLYERFGGIAAEMEGGSIGHVCYVNHVPFAVLRAISDSEGGAMDYETFAEKAALQAIDIVVEFIRRSDTLMF
ncbi:MAG: 5'-methylthioadenosine/adenosylhomocysteine nucleosidase [Clostridiales bacterium]|nr:5'-methylthioadenosine/adenosylhomocysteine nucleosidase [Clostridiales bacterium]